MPAVSGKSVLSGKIRPDVVKSHANDETDYGPDFARLPGGVSGIAQIVDCHFDVFKKGDNQGEPFFYVAGVVVEVGQQEKQFCVGRRTAKTMPACQTKNKDGSKTKSQEDNVAEIMNEMRKLGVDTRGVQSGEDLENLAAAILEAQPYFRFDTTQSDPTPQYPNPRVWENWHGCKDLEGYIPPERSEGAVQDNTAEAPKPKQQPKAATPAPTKSPTAPPKQEEKPSVEELAERANNDDIDAQNELVRLAKAAGTKQADIDNASDWTEVAGMIGEPSSEEPAAESHADSNGEINPSKEEIYFFTPKGKRKAIECEVTAVFEKARKVNLKSLEDGTAYKAVGWDDLKQE